jgi:hypothetical protein
MDKVSFSFLGILIIVVLVSLSSSESALAVQQQQSQNRPGSTAVAQVGLATRKILEQILTNYQNKEVKLLSLATEDKLDKAAAILEATSRLPEVKNLPYASILNKTLKTLHGIPQDADMAKRKVAQDILSKYKDFLAIGFIMPNGDVYMLEPYPRQVNITTPNLSFREYFTGAIKTGQTYVSDVIVSKATGRSVVTMATPVYLENKLHSPSSSSLAGVLYGVLNFDVYNGLLQSIANSTTADSSIYHDNNNSSSNNSRILLLDKNGIKIADSDITQLSSLSNKTKDVPFSHLEGFKNAIAGKSGSTIESVNGTKMLISYYPIKAIQSTWVVLSMVQPYDDR